MTQNQNESVTRHVGVKNDTVSKHARSKNETVSKHAEIKDSTIQKHAGSKNETEPKLAEEKNQIVSILHAGLKEGSGLYAFMKNRDLFYEVTQGNASSKLGSRMKPIKYFFKQIRTNLDRAFSAKILVAHKMFMKYDRMKYVPMTQIFKDCQDFSSSYKTLLGADIFQFSIFLRHFPDMFQIHEEYVLLKDIDLYELKRRYRAIILYPHALFNKGELPAPHKYITPFNVTLLETSEDGDHIAKDIYYKHTEVGFDIKGLYLGPDGYISICSISVSQDHAYVFDVSANPAFLTGGFLRKILEATNITKVVFDIENPASNLFREHNIILKNVFDTQVAFLILDKKYNALHFNYEEIWNNTKKHVSRSFLMALFDFDTNNIQEEFDHFETNNPAFWHYRPLCPVLLHYAGEDVYALSGIKNAMKNFSLFEPVESQTYLETRWLIRDVIKAARKITRKWSIPDVPIPRSVVRDGNIYNPQDHVASTQEPISNTDNSEEEIRKDNPEEFHTSSNFLREYYAHLLAPVEQNATTTLTYGGCFANMDSLEESGSLEEKGEIFEENIKKYKEYDENTFESSDDYNISYEEGMAVRIPIEDEEDEESQDDPEREPINTRNGSETHNVSIRDVSSFLTRNYFIDSDLSSLEENATGQRSPFRNRQTPYINNPITHPYIHNPVSNVESSCLLILIIGFFCIILFKWYKFWKNRASWNQQNKWRDILMRTTEDNVLSPDENV